MKFSLSLTACLAFTLVVGGCADQSHPAVNYLSHKTSSSQTQSTAKPTTTVISVAPTPLPTPMPEAQTLSSKAKAAILLPLTGKNAPLGQAMLNAAQQAVFDAAGNDFELQPRDTEAAGGAAEAAHAAIAAGAQIIIGPLFAADVPAVKVVAQSGGLPILPLSSDTSLAEHGIYVMGLAPQGQVERIVSYAAAKGAHNFAAIVPTTPFGALVGQVYTDAVARVGGVMVDYQTYDPALHAVADRAKDIATHKTEIDVLFLPEDGADLKMITDSLMASGWKESHAHLVGTGLWDVPNFAKQNAAMVGGWYAAPDPALRQTFVAAYLAAYGHNPPRLATLAYDATALAAVLAKHGARYDDAALTNPNGFAGLDGIFRLMPDGKVDRALTVNEITSESAKVIDAAPTSFVSKTR